MKIISITSPATDAGKTFIAASIAEAASARKIKTLFLEMDNPVGDSLRVFGASAKGMYPTMATWQNYSWEECLKSHAGTYILPKPDALNENFNLSLIEGLAGFDLIVADLGTDYRQNYWEYLISRSDLAILVSDCDEKAVVRIQTFLQSVPLKREWILIVNAREKNSHYPASQVERVMKDDIGNSLVIPYYPEAEKSTPKTLPPGNPEITALLDRFFDKPSETDFKPQGPHKRLSQDIFQSINKYRIKLSSINDGINQKNEITSDKISNKGSGGFFSLIQSRRKSGIINDGHFTECIFSDPLEVLPCDAVVMPASAGLETLKKYLRDPRSRTTPIVILRGGQKFMLAGADRCVKKITPELCLEMTTLAKRLRDLWYAAECDPLTGVYTRKFLNAWLAEHERQQKPYAAVMIDLDHFKNVNDTYGHEAGDAVLATFGEFLLSELRSTDIVARFGGEEFFIGLPATTAKQAQQMVNRIRETWARREISLLDNQAIRTTFSAGIAEWEPGCDVVAAVDKMLYKAKEAGRNRVNIRDKILVLGNIQIKHPDITHDPVEASCAISDLKSLKYAPDIPTYTIISSVSDWAAVRQYPKAIICSSVEDALSKIYPKPNLAVLPGARSGLGQSLSRGGALYLVCPARPALAGEIAAALCRDIKNSALICGVPGSVAAVELGVPQEQLIVSDWRIPGSNAPILHDDVTVWPIDPLKFSNIIPDIHRIVDQIKGKFSLTIVDCGGSLEACSRTSRDEGVLVLTREGDASEQILKHWLKVYGQSVTLMTSAQVPQVIEAENGFIINSAAAETLKNRRR